MGRGWRGLALLALVASGCGDGDRGGGSADAGGRAAAVIARLDADQIAARVAKLRGLRFDRAPRIATIASDDVAAFLTAGREGSRQAIAEAQRAGEAQLVLLKLQGVLPDGFDIEAAAREGDDALLGFYDPESNRLRLVAGGVATDRERLEPVAAHELTHALQDQSFGLRLGEQPADDPDALAAYRALVEGDAERVERAYAARYDLEPAAEQDPGGAGRLPFALAYDAAAPYVLGARFVDALVAETDSYRLVDRALRERPPTTMAEVADPSRYLAARKAARVGLDVAPVAEPGYERVSTATWGFNEAVELLAQSAEQLEEVSEAAAGWDGGRVELWSKGRSGCFDACRDTAFAVVGSSWRSAQAAEAYASEVLTALERRGAQRDGGAYFVAGAGAAVVTDGRELTMAWAPTAEQALALAERAQR